VHEKAALQLPPNSRDRKSSFRARSLADLGLRIPRPAEQPSRYIPRPVLVIVTSGICTDGVSIGGGP
jgi:hypothetical protein